MSQGYAQPLGRDAQDVGQQTTSRGSAIIPTEEHHEKCKERKRAVMNPE